LRSRVPEPGARAGAAAQPLRPPVTQPPRAQVIRNRKAMRTLLKRTFGAE